MRSKSSKFFTTLLVLAIAQFYFATNSYALKIEYDYTEKNKVGLICKKRGIIRIENNDVHFGSETYYCNNFKPTGSRSKGVIYPLNQEIRTKLSCRWNKGQFGHRCTKNRRLWHPNYAVRMTEDGYSENNITLRTVYVPRKQLFLDFKSDTEVFDYRPYSAKYVDISTIDIRITGNSCKISGYHLRDGWYRHGSSDKYKILGRRDIVSFSKCTVQ